MNAMLPTTAECVLALWQERKRKKTLSLVTIAKRYGGKRNEPNWHNRIEFTFDDATMLWIKGRGANHQCGIELP
jgi:hypothetical protein